MHRTIGDQLRDWRTLRRLSQLELAARAGVSQRHISFVETGRSRPSREMVMHLAETLDIPLRERNQLLHSAGFAAEFPALSLDSDELSPVRDALEFMLERHEPYPAVVLDRYWQIVMSNDAARELVATWVKPSGIQASAGNALRLLAHPEGLRRKLVNWPEVAGAMLSRMRREAGHYPGDAQLAALVGEIESYLGDAEPSEGMDLLVALHLREGDEEVRLFSTLATIGSPRDATVQELVIELFFPF